MYQSTSGNKTKHAYDYMNSKIKIIDNYIDRSFELSANSVYVRTNAVSREYDVLSIFVHTV